VTLLGLVPPEASKTRYERIPYGGRPALVGLNIKETKLAYRH